MRLLSVFLALLLMLTNGWLRAADSPPAPPPPAATEIERNPLELKIEAVPGPSEKIPEGGKASDILMKLAREAGISVLLSKGAAAQPKTFGAMAIPSDWDGQRVLYLATRMYGLITDDVDGVVCLKTHDELVTRNFSLHEAVQEHLADPKVAQAIAASKNVLFEALIEEKFNRQEALQIVMAYRTAKPNYQHKAKELLTEPDASEESEAPRPSAKSKRPVARAKSKGVKTPRVFEYEDKEVAEILRMLGKEFGISMVISDRVINARQMVTLRIENKSPREVIQILAKANDLKAEELDVVLYVNKRAEQPGLGIWSETLRYESQPEAARKVAKAKRAIFDALIAANFTSSEALQLVVAHEDPPPFGPFLPKLKR